MKKYAIVVDSKTKKCNVGLGNNDSFYKSIGMSEMDVEQAYDGGWYVEGYAPTKPLTQAKDEKYNENNQKAESAREGQSFTVTIDGTELAFLTDQKTQVDLQTALMFLQAGQSSYSWVDENGTSFNFTSASQIITVSETFMQKANVYAKWQYFKQQIDACTTVAEVEAVVIDYGINLEG